MYLFDNKKYWKLAHQYAHDVFITASKKPDDLKNFLFDENHWGFLQTLYSGELTDFSVKMGGWHLSHDDLIDQPDVDSLRLTPEIVQKTFKKGLYYWNIALQDDDTRSLHLAFLHHYFQLPYYTAICNGIFDKIDIIIDWMNHFPEDRIPLVIHRHKDIDWSKLTHYCNPQTRHFDHTHTFSDIECSRIYHDIDVTRRDFDFCYYFFQHPQFHIFPKNIKDMLLCDILSSNHINEKPELLDALKPHVSLSLWDYVRNNLKHPVFLEILHVIDIVRDPSLDNDVRVDHQPHLHHVTLLTFYDKDNTMSEMTLIG